MKCPRCLSGDSKVIDSRPVEENNSIRRRRECESCHFRFTTYEIIDTLTPIVVKKDGSHELFDKNKVLSGLLKACQKRPIDAVPIADEIEAEIRSSMKTEISSQKIGEMVMEKLKKLSAAMGEIRGKYGADAVIRGSVLEQREKEKKYEKKQF